MEKMKNMIVIKDIKSNFVEEAIIVFKENVKVKEKQSLGQDCTNDKTESFDRECCLKEAENIILDYVKKIEENRNENRLKIQMNALKMLNIFLVLTLLAVLFF